MSLYEECLELSLDWDSTEDIVHGCVEHVSKAKDAEIERLKAENQITVSVCNENTDLKKLITELYDALNRYGFDGICEPDPQKYDTETYLLDLIQRAREATR